MRAHLLIVLLIVGWLQPARAEEPHTFWGKTVEGWIAVFRDKASTEVQRRQAVSARVLRPGGQGGGLGSDRCRPQGTVPG